ncbi:VWA domain-containing protein [Gordonia sp. OPL2]|uniref:vWA domain-containing protein n=1 Tax=Gordonia sp. OPL2 TaxID=2486274 RepID=UPI00165607C8|nr:vWA domain-containing protein [Gordonia sp. OPL2]RPA02512.1 VWA domain-containing protein [Gordonia sp. OPL2]
MKPLRRRPKTLEEEPDLLVASSSGGGFVVTDHRPGKPGSTAPPGGPGAPSATDEDGEVATEADSLVVDDVARHRARRIARKLALAQVLHTRHAPRGATGTLVTRRWRGDSDEIDLDATLEAIAANPLPTDDDILVRQRVRRRRSIMLVVDISGSARGEQVRTAAATVGALVGELSRDAVGVIAFWSAAALISPLGEPIEPDRVVDQLLTLTSQGLTNVSFALSVAAEQLRGTPSADARVLLLSDCVHNAGPDPRIVAATLPRLDVLLDVSGEHDTDLGRDLARVGRGRAIPIRTDHDVAPALRRIFAG